MTKLNWDRARRRPLEYEGFDRLARAADKLLDPGAKQVKQLRKTMAKQPRQSGAAQRTAARTMCTNCHQPGAHILITAGMLPVGCLKVHMLCSRVCAAKAGFPWAGR